MSDTQQPTANAAQALGQLLRQERQARHLSIGDISERLKLPARQVEALETADYQKLPELVFVRGFLRSYGRFLNIDEEVLNNYLEQIMPQGSAPIRKPVANDAPVKMTYQDIAEKKPFPAWIFGVLAVAVIVGGVYAWQSKSNADNQRSNEQTEVGVGQVAKPQLNSENVQVLPMQSASDAVASATSASAPAASAPLANRTSAPEANEAQAASVPSSADANDGSGLQSNEGELAIKTRYRSFLTVTDKNGQMLISQIVPAHSEHRYSGNGPYHVRIGFARGSQVSYSGKDINVAAHMRDSKTAAFSTDDAAGNSAQ